MNQKLRSASVFVSFVFVLAATGCISIEENVVVRPDGTAQYGVDFAMLEMFAQGLAGMAGEGEPSLGEQWLATADSSAGDSVRLREFVQDADHHFAAERDFASLEQLAILSGRSDAPESIRAGGGGPDLPLGGIRITRLDGGRVRLRRTLENPSPARGARRDTTAESAASDASARRMFAGRDYVFRLTAPAIESANGEIAPDRKSATWRIPMASLAGDSAVVVEAVLVAGKAGKGGKGR
jgi:hypothetical protein